MLIERNVHASERLELHSSHKMNASICSMQILTTDAERQDLLLLTFSDAKMSLVEFDAAEGTLVTVSMHYYENEKHKVNDCR